MTQNKYQALDYYNLDELLTDEERMVRDLVRSWVGEEILPSIAEWTEMACFPQEYFRKMGDLGLFGATLPEKYGGAELSNIAYGLMMQELERGDSGFRSAASVQSSLVMFPIFKYGSEDQRLKYLPKLAAGEIVGCFGLTEPDSGSDPGSMKTTAIKDGDSYILNGAKMWITNGTIADVAVVWAKLDGKVRGFLVEAGNSGFGAPETKFKWSLRCSVTSELVFDDCRIPADAILPEGFGLSAPLSCLTQARYGIAWGVMGAAMACYDEAVKFALERISYEKPIASYQIVQQKITYMATEITKSQLLNFRLGQLKDAGTMKFQMVSMAKMNACYQALTISRMARDILGASGITYEYQSGRHMNNLESVYTYEGTHDIHSLIVGADLTGIEAYR
ncbi:acyl-CoA dehydrogenase family protein [Calditrichota bacterium]